MTELATDDNNKVEGAPGSILAQLQLAAAAQQEVRTTDIGVGGEFAGLLAIRYKPLSVDQMDRFVAKRAKQIERGGLVQVSSTEASMDLMAQACVCLIDKHGDPITYEDAELRLNAKLATALLMPFPEGYEPTAREVILKLFGNNAWAIDSHATALLEWMRAPGEDEGLGESRPTP